MRIKILVLFFSIIASLSLQGQDAVIFPDFKEADSHAKNLKINRIRTLQTLADEIAGPFTNDFLKARAIYTWIAYNVKYDCLAKHKLRRQIKDPITVAQKGRALSTGYSALFAELCIRSGIPCTVIHGFMRPNEEWIGKKLNKNIHSWNAINLNRKTYMVDVTWASGYTNKRFTKFYPKFDSIWFFVNPSTFLLSHFPKKKTDQFTTEFLSKSKFQKLPFLLPGAIVYEITKIQPENSLLKGTQGDTAVIEIICKNTVKIQSIFASSDEGGTSQLEFSTSQNKTIVKMVYKLEGKYNITFSINGIESFIYKANIKKNRKIPEV